MKEQQTREDIQPQLEIAQQVIALNRILHDLEDWKFPHIIPLRGSGPQIAAEELVRENPSLVMVPTKNPHNLEEMALIAPHSIDEGELANIKNEVEHWEPYWRSRYGRENLRERISSIFS